METIKLLNVKRLRQEEAFGYYALVEAELRKCTDTKFVPVYSLFKESLDAFDKSLKQMTASEFTRKLSILDSDRDNAYRVFCAAVIHGKHMSNPAKAEAAYRLQLILDKYGNPTNLPYIQENAVLINLLQDLRECQADVDAIGATVWVNEIEASNDAFIALFTGRNTERSVMIVGESMVARSTTDNAYRACVNRLNAMVEISGDAGYIEIILAINKLIDYEKSVLATRKTIAAKNNQAPLEQ